jgi:uncharacterized protein YndB with AHSA1/START domain
VVKKVAAKKPVAKKKVVKPAAKAKPVKKSAVKPKVAAKKVVTKKPVKKVAPKKVAKPVKKVVAKKAVKKAVAKKIVKKVAPKKAVKPAKKAVSKKVVAKKVAPKKAVKPVKKAAPVKVAVAKPVKVVVVKAPVVKAPVVKAPVVKAGKPAKVKKEKAPVIKKPIVAPTTFRKPENEVPTKFVKEPAGKFEMEFVIRASEDMVFEFVSTESGLSEWFCDDVNIRDGVFTFNWDGQIQQAKLIKEIPPISIRYQWLDKNDGSYFEFKTQKDELTNDISLIITDFASDKADEESARLLWHSQVDKLLHVLGSFF